MRPLIGPAPPYGAQAAADMAAAHFMSLWAATHALVRARSMACFRGSDTGLRRVPRLLPRTASRRHASEQCRALLLATANFLPYSPHSTHGTLVIALSAFAMQRMQ